MNDKRPPGIASKTVSSGRGKTTRKTSPTVKKAKNPQISTSTSQLRELSQLSKLDISDAQKIAAIKKAIEGGTFKVDSKLVADRLIDTAKESARKRNKRAGLSSLGVSQGSYRKLS